MDNALLKSVGEAVWKGMLLGFTIMSTITAVVLPASYVMNRFIYHAGPMRFILGLMAAHPAAFLVILIGRFINWVSNGTGGFERASYAGLIPLMEYDPASAGAPEGWLASLKRLGQMFIEPVSWVYDDTQYKKAVEQLLLPDTTKATSLELNGQPVTAFKGGVCAPFLAAAREAGAMENPREWRATMRMLAESGVGSMMFGGGVIATRVAERNTNSVASPGRSSVASNQNSNSGSDRSQNVDSLNLSPNSMGAQAGTPQEEIAPASVPLLSAAVPLLTGAAGSSLLTGAAAPLLTGAAGSSLLTGLSSSSARAGLSRLSSSSAGASLRGAAAAAAPLGELLQTPLSFSSLLSPAASPQVAAVASPEE
jgi:hypothetical protein